MSRMKSEFDFVAGVQLGNELFFNRFRLMIDFYTNSDVIEDHNIGIERINYFMTEIISRSIFVSEQDYDNILKYTTAGIPVLTVPHPGPFDPMVQAVVITKMNCILDDTLVITDAEIMSTVGSFITYVWEAADEDDEIHQFVDDEDDLKWWADADPRFASYHEDSSIEDHEIEKEFMTTWAKLGLQWVEDKELDDMEIEVELEINAGKNKVLKFDDFNRPTKPKK